MFGRPATVSGGEDRSAANKFAVLGKAIGSTPLGATVLRVEIPAAPSDAGVPVSLKVPGAVSLGVGEVLVIHILAEPDVADGDGESAWIPIESTYDPGSSTLRAVLRSHAFNEGPTGSRKATLMSGVARLSSVSPRVGYQGERMAQVQGASFNCPLANCIENSQFNYFRKTKKGSVGRWHMGMDLLAPVGQTVTGVSGATVTDGRSEIAWKRHKDLLIENKIDFKDCTADKEKILVQAVLKSAGQTVEIDKADAWQAVCGSGVFLSLRLPDGTTTKYFHLSEVSADLKDSATGDVIKGMSLGSAAAIGKTGATGLADPESGNGGPHLHFEHWIGSSPVDPFQGMVAFFEFGSPQGARLTVGEVISFQIAGKDSKDVPITSNVGNAVEAVPGDPTRKVCLSANYPNELVLEPSTYLRPSGELCYVWGATVRGVVQSALFDLTVTARFTVEPWELVPLDVLSGLAATTTIIPPLACSRDWPLLYPSLSAECPPSETLKVYQIFGINDSQVANLCAFSTPIPITITQTASNQQGSQTTTQTWNVPLLSADGNANARVNYVPTVCQVGTNAWVPKSALFVQEVPVGLGSATPTGANSDTYTSRFDLDAGGTITASREADSVRNYTQPTANGQQTVSYTGRDHTGIVLSLADGSGSFVKTYPLNMTTTTVTNAGPITNTYSQNAEGAGTWGPQPDLSQELVLSLVRTLPAGSPVPPECSAP